MFEFVAPVAAAQIGGYQTKSMQGVKVVSSRVNPLDTAEIYFPADKIEAGCLTRGMDVKLWLGYREKGVWPVFCGTIFDVSWGRVVGLYCRDAMERLRQITITQSFVDAVPQDIIQFALIKAGVQQYVLSQQVLPRHHHFIARGINVIQLIKLVNDAWGLDDQAFYFSPDGTFWWGPWIESMRYAGGQARAVLEYGRNLLSLVPSDAETGILKTFSLPFIQHSNLLLLRDRRFWQQEQLVRVERVCYTHGERETEMSIEWRIVPSS